MRSKENGFSALILIIVLGLLAIPIYYWVSTNSLGIYKDTEVKGAQTTGRAYSRPGFSVSIVSNSPTWDLVEYLCTSEEECLKSIDSGRRLGTVSGGKTDFHEVVVDYNPEWDNYDYIKFFVRTGWGSNDTEFQVTEVGDIPGSTIKVISDGTMKYEVVIAPTELLKNTYFASSSFSDKQL